MKAFKFTKSMFEKAQDLAAARAKAEGKLAAIKQKEEDLYMDAKAVVDLREAK